VARIRLHREWHGDEDSPHPPLLLIHGGGSTIPSNWGMLIPLLERSRSLLAVELQGHGRTPAGDREPSFEESADDVAAVLDELQLAPVDVLGFSNGGQVALQLAARHPERVRRLVLASTPVRREAMVEGFWEGLEAGRFEDLPAVHAEADLALSRDPQHVRRMFELDRQLMLGFTDFPDELIASVSAPLHRVTTSSRAIFIHLSESERRGCRTGCTSATARCSTTPVFSRNNLARWRD